MRVKFKDGNIVEAIRYTKEAYDSGELVKFITNLIKKADPSACDVVLTEKHDSSLDVTWRIGNGSSSILLDVNDWCYYDPKDNGVWGIPAGLFANHFLEKMPDEETKETTIQEDIRSLERKISRHLQELGAVSGDFIVGGNPVKFKAIYEIDWNNPPRVCSEEAAKSVDDIIEKFKRTPWTFTEEKGGRRG